jgi:hypothetical protein
MTATPGRRPPRRAWTRWPAERLLDLRIRDLDLRIEGTWIARRVRHLHDDLAERGLRLKPHVWLSSDWFSPAGVPGIAIPFYLAHPRLMRLERTRMLEVEGGTREEFDRILRHEAGHAVQQAWRLHHRREWQRLFGHATKRYPTVYRPNPASRRYVQHLRLYYAQSHPEEDFAETFAVWLMGPAFWKRRYRGWPAVHKLEYVDRVIGEIAGTTPPVRSRRRVEPAHSIRKTLREYYAEKQGHYSTHFPDVYDRDLKRLFSEDPGHKGHERASTFLRRNRVEIRRLVSRWTGEYQFTLDQVLKDMIGRSRELKLRAVGPERQLRMDFAVLLTVKTVHSLYGPRGWIAL